jgi:RNA:NAD 2'-phosphotransferase (TPT1/KptA family)
VEAEAVGDDSYVMSNSKRRFEMREMSIRASIEGRDSGKRY